MSHPALTQDAVAVVTGAASGIGLAAAIGFAKLGLAVVLVDLGATRLADAASKVSAVALSKDKVLAVETDVSKPDDLVRLEETVATQFGGTDILMNNAGIQIGSSIEGPVENWEKVMAVNLWGPIHGSRIFLPRMQARGRAGLIINTGSKQGITTPPGDPAYNVAKAGLKVYTEQLQHMLRNVPDGKLSAHLLIPGFVFTGLSAAGGHTEKPPGAWSAEQTVDFMLAALAAGDFYVLCPDNEVSRALDEKRILWAAGDIVENRPPLSRWHKDHAEAFKASLSAG
jgi:NAD(P)-dependent dehydrogenase (short-subunit alcohol dehydrogenase family)